MEPEKVIRIVSLFLLIAASAIHAATRLMFPEAPNHTLSIIVLCMLAAGNAISDRGSRRRAGNDRQQPHRTGDRRSPKETARRRPHRKPPSEEDRPEAANPERVCENEGRRGPGW